MLGRNARVLFRQLHPPITTRSKTSNDRFNFKLEKFTNTSTEQNHPSLCKTGDGFMDVFEDIVGDFSGDRSYDDIREVTGRYAEVLRYNVTRGRQERGRGLLAAYRRLERPGNLTAENARRAAVLGWCVEMLQAFIMMADDIMDRAETRYGIPCWYRKAGAMAVNDVTLVENGIYVVLKKRFSHLRCYVPIVELFHDVALKTALGQVVDVQSVPGGTPDLDVYTMDRYNLIVKYKTQFYFTLPMSGALYLANRFDPEEHRQANVIMKEIGLFCQVQDDFLDCFLDPPVTGKTGTDIAVGKCSWMIVTALQRATPAQRKLLRDNYARSDPEAVRVVKGLYEELNLPAIYAKHEEERYNFIRTLIQQSSDRLPAELFFGFIERLC